MKKVYVRIHLKVVAERFFRCGFEFKKAWKPVEVDDATLARLNAEQMLEVSETKPADYEDTAAGDSAQNTSTAGDGSGTPAAAPTDPAERLAAIRAAVSQLDKEDASLWTGAGKPKTEAIVAITGWPVTAAERDAALVEVQ